MAMEVVVEVAIDQEVLWVDADGVLALCGFDLAAEIFDHVLLPGAGSQNFARGIAFGAGQLGRRRPHGKVRCHHEW